MDQLLFELKATEFDRDVRGRVILKKCLACVHFEKEGNYNEEMRFL